MKARARVNRTRRLIAISAFLRDDEAGVTIWGLFWFILFVAFGGLAVDTTNAFRVQTMLQATADASAHAAVQSLPDEADAVSTALEYAEKNMASVDFGEILAEEDVDLGGWDPLTRTFLDGASPPNAVRVTLRSTAATGNPVPVNFLRIAGLMEWNISVQAIAATGGSTNDCINNGFFSRGKVYTGSTNNYVDRICIHGDLGVKVGSTNYFESGVSVTMLDLNDLEASQDNTGLEEALGEVESVELPLVGEVSNIVAGLAGDVEGSIYTPAGFLTVGPINVQYLPSTKCGPDDTDPTLCLLEGTLYVVQEVVDFGSGSSGSPLVISNIGVVGRQEIKTGSNVTLSNVMLATNDKVSLGSENVIGQSYCDSGDGEVYIYAGGEYSAGSQSSYSGAQIVGEGIVKLGSELHSMEAINVQAGGDIFWGSADTFGGCGGPGLYLPSVAGPGNGSIAIVF